MLSSLYAMFISSAVPLEDVHFLEMALKSDEAGVVEEEAEELHFISSNSIKPTISCKWFLLLDWIGSRKERGN
jgi:hypothetical protein